MSDWRRAVMRRDVWPWIAAFSLLALAVLVRNLMALDAAPPGMYVDEASIGYNAWAIAHYGVDEHGTPWPLYFQAFGEYKNPVYVYALAALLRVLPLSAAVERVPAALFGAVALLFVVLTAWRVSRSRGVTLCMLVIAALTPWLTQESRVGFEVVSMVTCLCVVVWCLAGDPSARRFALAGVFLALSVLAYSAGRVEVLLFTGALAFWYRGRHGWWLALIPVGAMYAVVGFFALTHPGALTAEFSVVNIGVDGASFPVLAARFLNNYVQYFSPDFLFVHGDPNLRHNSDYAGMLLVVTAPLVLLGLLRCWRLRRDPLAGFTVTCLLLAPLSGALTVPAPHALRGAAMLPFLFVLTAYGIVELRSLIRDHRARLAVVAVCGLAAAVQGGFYSADYFGAYPQRSAEYFDTGVLPAVLTASSASAGGHVYLSQSLDEQPYIDALMVLLPPPPRTRQTGSAVVTLQALHVSVVPATVAEQAAASGDVLVLAASDPVPPSAALIATEDAPGAQSTPLVVVYRRQ